MKKNLICISMLVLFSGCVISQNDIEDKETVKTVQAMAQQMKTIVFTNVKMPSQKFSITSNDEFQSAIFIDVNAKKHDLKRDISANGIRLVNKKDGIDLIFYRGTGYLTTENGLHEIELKYKE